MSFATRETFLTGMKRRYSSETLPQSGAIVRFQSLADGEMTAYEMSSWKRDESGALRRDDDEVLLNRPRLIVACVVDEEGNKLLTDADIPQIQLLDGDDMTVLVNAIRLHCGFDRPAKKNEPTS